MAGISPGCEMGAVSLQVRSSEVGLSVQMHSPVHLPAVSVCLMQVACGGKRNGLGNATAWARAGAPAGLIPDCGMRYVSKLHRHDSYLLYECRMPAGRWLLCAPGQAVQATPWSTSGWSRPTIDPETQTQAGYESGQCAANRRWLAITQEWRAALTAYLPNTRFRIHCTMLTACLRSHIWPRASCARCGLRPAATSSHTECTVAVR